MYQIILYHYHLLTIDSRRRVRTEIAHHLLYLLSPTLALPHHRHQAFLIKPVLLVNIHQHIIERLAILSCPRRNLCNHRTRTDGILVAHKITYHIPITLLSTCDERLHPLQFTYLARNILETCQHIVHLNASTRSNIGRELTRHNSLHHILIARKHLLLLPLLHNIVKQNAHRLVAIKQHPLPVRLLCRNAYSVGIRVTRKHYVRIYLLCQIHRHLHRGLLFWIGARRCREITIRDGLCLHNIHIGEPQLLQHTRYEGYPRSMQWSIHDFNVAMLLY